MVIDKLMQTEESFDLGDCEAMMQLWVFVIALLLVDENLKDEFISPLMEMDEEIQEALFRVIQVADSLIETLQASG